MSVYLYMKIGDVEPELENKPDTTIINIKNRDFLVTPDESFKIFSRNNADNIIIKKDKSRVIYYITRNLDENDIEKFKLTFVQKRDILERNLDRNLEIMNTKVPDNTTILEFLKNIKPKFKSIKKQSNKVYKKSLRKKSLKKNNKKSLKKNNKKI